MKTSILALSNQKPRQAWKAGCSNLGINLSVDLGKPNPTVAELEIFFRSTPDWIYFGGHWSCGELYNNNRDVAVLFSQDSVTIEHSVNGERVTKTIKKGNGFNLNKNCKVIVWGACSVLSDLHTIETLRQLFNNPLMLGLSTATGWRINNAILSGDFPNSRGGFVNSASSCFFHYLNVNNINDEKSIKNAFLDAAWHGWGNTLIGKHWKAIDSNGAVWGSSKNGPVQVGL